MFHYETLYFEILNICNTARTKTITKTKWQYLIPYQLIYYCYYYIVFSITHINICRQHEICRMF